MEFRYFLVYHDDSHQQPLTVAAVRNERSREALSWDREQQTWRDDPSAVRYVNHWLLPASDSRAKEINRTEAQKIGLELGMLALPSETELSEISVAAQRDIQTMATTSHVVARFNGLHVGDTAAEVHILRNDEHQTWLISIQPPTFGDVSLISVEAIRAFAEFVRTILDRRQGELDHTLIDNGYTVIDVLLSYDPELYIKFISWVFPGGMVEMWAEPYDECLLARNAEALLSALDR